MAVPSHKADLPAFTFRRARPKDAKAIANLATQLGYPTSALQVASRMRVALKNPKHLILTALSDRHVIAWVHGYVSGPLESDPYVEIGGLVVDESHRGKGVGTALLDRVESWARQKRCETISVRSNIIRHGAHRFYAARGYEQVKTQHTFRKRLQSSIGRDQIISNV